MKFAGWIAASVPTATPSSPTAQKPSTRRSERSARRSARRRRSMSDRSGGTRTGAQVGSGTGLVSPLEERLDLGLLVAAVAAQRVDPGDVPVLHPDDVRIMV